MATARLRSRTHQLLLTSACTLLLMLTPQAFAKKDKDSPDSTGSGNDGGGSVWAQEMFGMAPPYISTTISIGTRMKGAQEPMLEWLEAKVHDLVQYDAYTELASDDKRINEFQKYCGKNAKSCDFTKADMAQNLIASNFIDVQAYVNKDEEEAAIAFMKYITNPKPLEYPGDKKVYKDGKKGGELTDDGKKYVLGLYETLPTMTMAQNSFAAIFNDRQRYPDFGKDLPVGEKGEASMMEVLQYEATRRYGKKDWYDQMNAASTEALLREIANIQALNIFLEIRRYEQMSRIEGLMAAQLAALAQFNQSSIASSQRAQDSDATGEFENTIGVE